MRRATVGWQALKRAVASLERQLGGGSLLNLGEPPPAPEVSAISSGSLGLDLALGVGGFARGRIAEIYGEESSGKTTLALHAIAQAQRQGGVCAFIDAEHALSPAYAQALGVDPRRLLVAQPDSGEQALEICALLARSDAIALLVLDSVAALVPRAELQGGLGGSFDGLQARLMSQAMRKLAAVARRADCAMLFLNQVRQRPGLGPGCPAGEVTPGGGALKFYASTRLHVQRLGLIHDGPRAMGHRARIQVVKSAVSAAAPMAAPCRKVEVDLLYGRGFWPAGDLAARAQLWAPPAAR